MKQTIQNLRNGKTDVLDVPAPKVSDGHILIASSKTLISSGTERMLLEFGRANLLKKAALQPERVREVYDKIKTDGLVPTLERVFSKLDTPLPLGYCNIGRVIDVGLNVEGFKKGDRVISNGHHAEIVSVPKNLCCKVPDDVEDENAVFCILASIGLQAVRLCQPTIGETFVVFGLGLVGLSCMQILKANGCNVICVDYNQSRLNLAAEHGASTINLSQTKTPIEEILFVTRGLGVDGCIIATATQNTEPLDISSSVSRQRGRIILVGDAGLKINRTAFYKKELSFQVSASYGPGRYDELYEEKGFDYPFGLVRWTENRNFQAILALMQENKLDFSGYITHEFEINKAKLAYEKLVTSTDSLGIILNYESSKLDQKRTIALNNTNKGELQSTSAGKITVNFIGAGNHSKNVLLPALARQNVEFGKIASKNGLNASFLGKKYKFRISTSDYNECFEHTQNSVLVVAARHDLNAQLILKALQLGKHIYLEKPLCIKNDELEILKLEHRNMLAAGMNPVIMVGFNRRFSKHGQLLKSLLTKTDLPKSFVMTINAGKIDAKSWIQDRDVGGRRIIGEVCHFIDFIRFLCGCKIVKWSMECLESQAKDSYVINLKFQDGSIASINYFSNGNKGYVKEKLDVFCNGAILSLNNFKSLRGYGWPGFNKHSLFIQDKGQKTCVKNFIDAVKGRESILIPFQELLEIAEICIDLEDSWTR